VNVIEQEDHDPTSPTSEEDRKAGRKTYKKNHETETCSIETDCSP
jgi:hypothetical protein